MRGREAVVHRGVVAASRASRRSRSSPSTTRSRSTVSGARSSRSRTAPPTQSNTSGRCHAQALRAAATAAGSARAARSAGVCDPPRPSRRILARCARDGVRADDRVRPAMAAHARASRSVGGDCCAAGSSRRRSSWCAGAAVAFVLLHAPGNVSHPNVEFTTSRRPTASPPTPKPSAWSTTSSGRGTATTRAGRASSRRPPICTRRCTSAGRSSTARCSSSRR